MRIAIVGSGIAGLTAAHELHGRHDIVLFEAAPRVGGHTRTVTVELDGRDYDVDTGFVVYNERTYPHFVALLRRLGVASRETEMGFSVRCERTGREYSGSSLRGLFATWSNLFRPSFHRMLRDILRFNRVATESLARGIEAATLGEFVAAHRFSREFVEQYLVPMGAAIWSSGPGRMVDFPAALFVRFFHNHGLLTVNGQPRWRTVLGGSRRYVEALTRPFQDRIRTACPVRRIERRADGVELACGTGERQRFDRVVLACHSDQALELLGDPTPAEREVLGAIAYERNEVVLHTDESLLPRRRAARASWNYTLPGEPGRRVAVTYDMSRLQGLDSPVPFCVTLNRTERIDRARILKRMVFSHPVFNQQALEAQRRRHEIDGVNRIHYCGAYWRHGFHEDGVVSALDVIRRIERRRAAA